MNLRTFVCAGAIALAPFTFIHAQTASQPRQQEAAPAAKSPSTTERPDQGVVAPNSATNPAPDQSHPAGKDAAQTVAKPAPQYGPQRQCVDDGEFSVELGSGRRPVGDTIVIDTNFLPTGQSVDVGVRTPYVDGARYFAALERDDGRVHILDRQDVVTRRAVSADNLVKKKLIEPDQTIVSIDMYSEDAGRWQKSDLYLYTCGTSGSPARVSKVNIRLSPYSYSLWIAGLTVLIAYLWLAYALRKHDSTFESYLRALNPVKITSGPDGKGSLSKFQVLCFSLLVFGLILLFMLQTGMLTDLSLTVLTLLGINGLGATLAKGADTDRNTISGDNKAWLLRRNWIQVGKGPVDNSKASWADFFSTDGEFDVYRYQSFIFALVVAGALIAAGVSQLSTFTIPDTILGIVGLSQAVYIGGKLVTRTNMADLNDAIADLRDREKKLRGMAVAANQGAPVAGFVQAIPLVGQAAYDAYMEKARDVGALYTAETHIPLDPAALQPSFSP
jgi:hypothetical protein